LRRTLYESSIGNNAEVLQSLHGSALVGNAAASNSLQRKDDFVRKAAKKHKSDAAAVKDVPSFVPREVAKTKLSVSEEIKVRLPPDVRVERSNSARALQFTTSTTTVTSLAASQPTAVLQSWLAAGKAAGAVASSPSGAMNSAAAHMADAKSAAGAAATFDGASAANFVAAVTMRSDGRALSDHFGAENVPPHAAGLSRARRTGVPKPSRFRNG